MYIPKQFEEKDWETIAGIIRDFGFATLVSVNDGLPWATHIPLELDKDKDGKWLLHGHLAKANPQWRNFETDTNVLAIFMGPHSYVSPTWYNHKNVPTWNYQIVHVYGKVSLVEGEELKTMLRKLMARYENAHAEKPLTFDELPEEILSKDLNGLVGIEIKVERIEAASKLSQNRDKESYDSVVEHLKKMEAYDSKQVAKAMEKAAKK